MRNTSLILCAKKQKDRKTLTQKRTNKDQSCEVTISR